ncbi:GyrI-like domain-containing protein [Nonomuraea sp. NPDC049709]|uniref:GyrI-like domain-containing protein n=1 Tax=Nonomuraea sp. NPDC049709 TaxID=3154736 RepID=UPI00341A23C3
MPQIVEFPERPYAGVRRAITMTTFGLVGDRIGEIIGWLAERGIAPAGAPFLRYHSIDMANDRLVVEAGVPVATPVEGEGDILPGTLPAGRYVAVSHHGHLDQLAGVIESLLKWAGEQGLEWDMTDKDGVEHWGCRLELYNTNPMVEPDMNNWDTDLQFRLA